MSRHDEDIVGEKPCKCGCGKNVKIRKRHLYPSKSVPDYIKGHQQYGNKRGWKGGEIKDARGYVWSYAPDHPNKNAMGKGYVKRSRLLMEKKIGRYLTKNEAVHHINGIRDDDRIENLIVMTKSAHSSHHSSLNMKIMKRNKKNGRFEGVSCCQ